MFNFASHRTPRSFARTLPSSWLVAPLHRIIPLVVQHFAFPFVTLYEIPANSLLQPAEVPLKDRTNNWSIKHSFHFTTICKLSGYQVGKHDIPFVNPSWQLPIIFLSLRCLQRASMFFSPSPSLLKDWNNADWPVVLWILLEDRCYHMLSCSFQELSPVTMNFQR